MDTAVCINLIELVNVHFGLTRIDAKVDLANITCGCKTDIKYAAPTEF